MEYKAGDKILIEVEVVRRTADNRTNGTMIVEPGYVVKTSQNREFRVEPWEIVEKKVKG